MSRTLYILVTSERPDPYLNSIAHCLLYEGVREVEFLYIEGLDDPPLMQGLSRGRSATAWENVSILLRDLAMTGEYIFLGNTTTDTKVNLREFYSPDDFKAMQETYRQCRQLAVQWNHRDIAYSELRKEIAAIASKKPSPIIDVTAVKKRYIGDLIACGIIEGLKSLHTFDLIQGGPNFKKPWTTLYHDLKPNGSSEAKFQYVNLLNTKIFDECSRSLLVKGLPTAVPLALSIIALVGLLIIFFVQGLSSPITQVANVVATVASILSGYLAIYPLRRQR